MLFIFLDDQTLDVLESSDEARDHYEDIDVENGEFTFFDANCCKLTPLIPPDFTKFGSGSGRFILREPQFNKGEFLERLKRCSGINPNRWFKTIEDVRKHAENAKAP